MPTTDAMKPRASPPRSKFVLFEATSYTWSFGEKDEQLPQSSFSSVVCIQVLEHLPERLEGMYFTVRADALSQWYGEPANVCTCIAYAHNSALQDQASGKPP